MQPDVSVICANLNHMQSIDECVQSVLAQTGGITIEMIVADGGSTDGSLEYLKEHPKVNVIEGPDSGPVEALTKALKAASGRYIMLTTSTDGYVSKRWFKTAVSLLDSNPNLSMVCGQACIMTSDGLIQQSNGITPATNPDQWFMHWLNADTFEQTWLNELGYCVRAPVFRHCWNESSDFPDADLIKDRVIRLNFEFIRLGFIHAHLPFIANFNRRHHSDERPQLMYEAAHWDDTATYMKLVKQYADDLKAGIRKHYFRNGIGEVIGEPKVPVLRPLSLFGQEAVHP